MPVIVVGADSPAGEAIVARVVGPDREVRAFVSDPRVGARLKEQGVKVALGDLSDASHVSGACLRCHTAVLICGTAHDGREISFAASPDEVFTSWAEAVTQAQVRRVIWVGEGDLPHSGAPEEATVTGRHPVSVIAERVAALDDAISI